MKLRCYDIEYDLSDYAEDDPKMPSLPKEVIVSISKKNYDSGKVQVVDLITEQTGEFVLSHEHEEI